jgi:DNA-binding transcriptional LysR family regulator
MMPIDEQVFYKFDVNSLVAFLVVFREQGVSQAAKSLNVTQPAVSNVLRKLRRRFDDPLFIRGGGAVMPTSKAIMIAHALQPAMMTLQDVLARCSLAPSEMQRRSGKNDDEDEFSAVTVVSPEIPTVVEYHLG